MKGFRGIERLCRGSGKFIFSQSFEIHQEFCDKRNSAKIVFDNYFQTLFCSVFDDCPFSIIFQFNVFFHKTECERELNHALFYNIVISSWKCSETLLGDYYAWLHWWHNVGWESNPRPPTSSSLSSTTHPWKTVFASRTNWSLNWLFVNLSEKRFFSQAHKIFH